MKTIWKYRLKGADRETVPMAYEAKILSVQLQDGNITVWALVDTALEGTQDRTFETWGTGHKFDYAHRVHLGTVQQDSFVWHIFERISP